jgi:hypothetical protein
MYAQKITLGLKSFAYQNWFKLLCMAILLYLLFQKDLSFQVNLSSPSPFRSEPEERGSPARERLSNRGTEGLGGVLFDLLPFSSERALKSVLKANLKLVHEDAQIAYLRRFAKVALAERDKYGIPSSIILANALLFSGAGSSTSAVAANNHFRLGCQGSWTGSKWQEGEQCFRAYENAWASFRDFSEYLSREPFVHLHQLGLKDYKGWADGLEKGKFQHEPELATTLLELIEHFRLYELDRQ